MHESGSDAILFVGACCKVGVVGDDEVTSFVFSGALFSLELVNCCSCFSMGYVLTLRERFRERELIVLSFPFWFFF